LTSNLFLPSLVLSDGPDLNAFAEVFGLEEVAISASGISMSAMVEKESPRSTEIEGAKYRRLLAGAYERRSLQKTRPRMRR
jgi:hypothetical protein